MSQFSKRIYEVSVKTSNGDVGALDKTTFASLVAGDFAASDQLAALLGESEFTSLYHQGEGRAMFLADVGGWAILAALFDGRTTLGMVRLKSKAVVPRFARLLAAASSRSFWACRPMAAI